MQAKQALDKRADFRISVDLLLNKYVKGRPYLCRATNLSRSGLLVHRLFEPEHGETRVGLQFQLPGCDRVITCAGRIVFWDEQLGAHGVEFTSVAPEHQALLDTFLLRSMDWPAALEA
ncbi:MAG: PilZ domain-containing protein [Deltaproteobacteria bacterium]|nr:PilZ domain-containing protein [Deltaproteobacteria bacterium]